MERPTKVTEEELLFPATADVWLSTATTREQNSSAGKSLQLKLKNIQEMAIFRFDVKSLAGRKVLDASLRLHRKGPDKLRYLRVSTVNQDWREGDGDRPLWSARRRDVPDGRCQPLGIASLGMARLDGGRRHHVVRQ